MENSVIAPAVFMEFATEVEWLRGRELFRVFDPNTGSVRVVEPAVLAECIANAACAYREFRTRHGAKVIAFPGLGEIAG